MIIFFAIINSASCVHHSISVHHSIASLWEWWIIILLNYLQMIVPSYIHSLKRCVCVPPLASTGWSYFTNFLIFENNISLKCLSPLDNQKVKHIWPGHILCSFILFFFNWVLNFFDPFLLPHCFHYCSFTVYFGTFFWKKLWALLLHFFADEI